MKKLFLILIPIVFLFCLNIGIQTVSAVTCGSCEKCASQSCNQWGETCTPHSRWVCDEEGCTGYGDVPYNCRNECVTGMTYGCVGSMDYVCTNWNPGQCHAWDYQGNCSLYGGGYCKEGHYACSQYGYYCPGGSYSYICDYKVGCISYGCISGHTETWTECAPNGNCVGGWYCTSCSPYCSGSDSDCGCASCADCNVMDKCVGAARHDYSCSGNSCAVNIIENASGCKVCDSAADCTDYSVGECIDASSKIASIGCNADNSCFYTTESSLAGQATDLHNGILYQYNPCDKSIPGKDIFVPLTDPNGVSCETHCEGNELYVPGIWESGIGEGCNWNVESCGSCGCSSSGCVATGPGPCPDFCENSNLFTNGFECNGKCIWGEPLHCDHGCASPDCAYAPGGCAASCTGYTCGNAECAGCPFCSVSCPDVCFGSIFETGGYVSNNENSEMTCFYSSQEWCGNGCCSGPILPPPPSCYWGQKSCGWGGGGCGMNEMGYQCKGPSGCTEEECSKGDTYCEVDLSCSGGPPPLNDPPVAEIYCDPLSCNIYTDGTITFYGDNSYDSDGFITRYDWEVLGSFYPDSGDSCMPSATPEGNHTATLTVKDDKGATGSTTKNFTVIQALTADFEWDPEFPLRNEEVDFTDKSAGDITTYTWTFTDGNPLNSNIQNPTDVIFNSKGSKDVTLEICNGLGDCDDITKQIEIKIPMPKWRETHPKSENIFDNPFLIFASLLEYFEG